MVQYTYLFNATSDPNILHLGKVVSGASLTVKLRFFKGSEEVLPDAAEMFKAVTEIRKPHDPDLPDVVKISFDRQRAYRIRPVQEVVDFFKKKFQADRLTYAVAADGFSIDVEDGPLKEKYPDAAGIMDESLASAPVSEPMPVSEEVFRCFLLQHADQFDNGDNICAQCVAQSP